MNLNYNKDDHYDWCAFDIIRDPPYQNEEDEEKQLERLNY